MKRMSVIMALASCSAGPSALAGAAGRSLPSVRSATHSELVLACEPSDAQVELDGVPQGTCQDFQGKPRGLAIVKGVHRVEVNAPGYIPWATLVDTDGTRIAMVVTLLPKSGGAP